jgi:hypothetical protein
LNDCDFGAIVVAAAILVHGTDIREGLASENAMRSVRIGIVGFMGRTYAECLTKYNQGATLIAITGGSRAATLVFEYGEIQI